MSTIPYLSIIIPSYNEMKNIQRGVLDEMWAFVQTLEMSWEMVMSDDGSTDGTLDELQKFAKRSPHITVLKNVHAGKGPTVQSGMLAASGEWRLFADFDQSAPLREVSLLLKYTPQFSVVIGSREIAGAKRRREPLHRHIMGKGFNILVRILAIPDIADTQCGFKLFSAAATSAIFPNLFVYGRHTKLADAFTGAFDVEALYLARKLGYKIKEVPIFWQHNESNRVSPVKDSLRMLRDIIKIRIADMQGKYKFKQTG